MFSGQEGVNLTFQFEEHFENSGLILFLNKKDVFEEKISARDNRIPDFFPDYDGPATDRESVKGFILSKFEELLPEQRRRDGRFYHHFTCATDTENINNIFMVVRDRILHEHLREIGLR